MAGRWGGDLTLPSKAAAFLGVSAMVRSSGRPGYRHTVDRGDQRVQTQEAITLTSTVQADAAVAGNVVAERYRDAVSQLHAKFGASFTVEHVSHALTATPAGVTPVGYIATVLIAYSYQSPPPSQQRQTAAVSEDKPAIVEKLLGGLTTQPLDSGTQPAR